MANDKKQPPPELPHEKKPLENPRVDVSVMPAKRSERDHAQKVGESIQKDVEKAIRENAGKGHVEQLKRAIETAQEKGGQMQSEKIRQVDVDVSGKVGRDRKKASTTVVPSEPGPKPSGPQQETQRKTAPKKR